jgi:hypothetical protein
MSRSIDDLVRAVTAFRSLDEMKAVPISYTHILRPSAATSNAALSDMYQVAAAYNLWARQLGRPLARVYPKPISNGDVIKMAQDVVRPSSSSILLQPRNAS